VWPGPSDGNVRVVVNKVDLAAAWDWKTIPHALPISALTGAGVPELCQALAGWLVPEPPTPGAAVPFNAFLCDKIEEAKSHCSPGRIEEARQALHAALGAFSPLPLGERGRG